MSKWQPIKTAPKDGTAILLAYKELCGSGYWWQNSSKTREHWVWDGWPRMAPTHWMPLPKPPNVKSGG